MPTPGLVLAGQSGCLLPMLIMLNLFFGKLIFTSTRLWLGVEGILILLFIIKVHTFIRKISEQLWPQGHGLQQDGQSHRPQGHGLPSDWQSQAGGVSASKHGRGKVIDVQGEVVEEKQKLE